VRLADGRTMVAGGGDDEGEAIAWVEALAADGSGWSALHRCSQRALTRPTGCCEVGT
jgi:hypothetical protein